MELYVAFSNDAILEGAAPQKRLLEGQTQTPIQMETPTTPITEELEGIQVLELGVSPTPQEMEEPTKELVPTEMSAKEVVPMEESTEELTALTVMFIEPAEEPDVSPAVQGERKGGGAL